MLQRWQAQEENRAISMGELSAFAQYRLKVSSSADGNLGLPRHQTCFLEIAARRATTLNHPLQQYHCNCLLKALQHAIQKLHASRAAFTVRFTHFSQFYKPAQYSACSTGSAYSENSTLCQQMLLVLLVEMMFLTISTPACQGSKGIWLESCSSTPDEQLADCMQEGKLFKGHVMSGELSKSQEHVLCKAVRADRRTADVTIKLFAFSAGLLSEQGACQEVSCGTCHAQYVPYLCKEVALLDWH